MARKAKKPKTTGRGALLKNHIYKDFGGTKQSRKARSRVSARKARDERRETTEAISKGQQMARIEAYAKEHRISVTQAMVRLMES